MLSLNIHTNTPDRLQTHPDMGKYNFTYNPPSPHMIYKFYRKYNTSLGCKTIARF